MHKKSLVLCVLVFISGIGLSFVNIDTNRESFTGMVTESRASYFIFNSFGERLYVYHKENSYDIGDVLTIEGKKEELNFVTLESQFDFEDYLNKKGINYELNAKKITVKFSSPIRINQTREKFLSHFSSEQQSLIRALLFSQRDESLDLDNINALHISRLASASGVFIYGYLILIKSVIAHVTKKKKLQIIPLITLLPYFIFTFPRFTIVRILVLEVFRYINANFLKRKLTSLEITSIVGLGFLILDYHLGYQPSFILGYTMPFIISFIRDANMRIKGKKKKLIEMVDIYLATIPFEFKFYSGLFPLSIIAITLLSPLFIFTSILCLFGFYGLPIYSFIAIVINVLSNVLSTLSKFTFQIHAPPINGLGIVMYMLLYFAFLYYRTVNFIPLTRIFGAIITAFIVIYCLPIENLITTEVCFINVGQGDSCLIRKGNTTILIDTGGLKYRDLAKETLIPFFKKKRIYDIDLVITTHDDYDHMGALESLQQNYYVKNVVNDATVFPLEINGITLTNYNTYGLSSTEENDKSLVIGFNLGKLDFLITGDAPISIENKIMENNPKIPCDILKVGHHGSKTSTSDRWVKYLDPVEAVISVAENNRYGHPNNEVLNTLTSNGVRIRRTDLEGTITYRSYIFM